MNQITLSTLLTVNGGIYNRMDKEVNIPGGEVMIHKFFCIVNFAISIMFGIFGIAGNYPPYEMIPNAVWGMICLGIWLYREEHGREK